SGPQLNLVGKMPAFSTKFFVGFTLFSSVISSGLGPIDATISFGNSASLLTRHPGAMGGDTQLLPSSLSLAGGPPRPLIIGSTISSLGNSISASAYRCPVSLSGSSNESSDGFVAELPLMIRGVDEPCLPSTGPPLWKTRFSTSSPVDA